MAPDPLTALIGNEQVKQYLRRMVAKDAIAQSLLFAGAAGAGKTAFAKAFAELLLTCNDPEGCHAYKLAHGVHPDLYLLAPEGKIGMHSIDAIRELIQEIHLPPLEGRWKVFIIQEAERMLTYSSNALLKTFEEPTPHSVIILTCSQPQLLLPTVRSRCRYIPFKAVGLQQTQAKIQTHSAAQQLLLQILAGSPTLTYSAVLALLKQIIELVEEDKKDTEKKNREIQAAHSAISDMPALQRHILEREVEGAVTMRRNVQSHALFEMVLQWIRDLHVTAIVGKSPMLFYPDAFPALEQAAKRGNLPPLEEALQAAADARLALERSTSLALCMENLLLRTGFIS